MVSSKNNASHNSVMEVCCIKSYLSGSLIILSNSDHAKCHVDLFPRGKLSQATRDSDVSIFKKVTWETSLSLISCPSLGLLVQ